MKAKERNVRLAFILEKGLVVVVAKDIFDFL
jgi:hypothetical protein